MSAAILNRVKYRQQEHQPQESQCEKDVMVDLARAQAHHALVDHAQQFDPPGGEQPADAVAVADVERVGRGEDFAFAHGGALAAVLGQRRGDGLKPFGEGFARVLQPDLLITTTSPF